MMCKYPFIRDPHGTFVKYSSASYEERLAATPFGCGRCLPCRINRARVWTTRLLLEQRTHDKNAFVTLTYDDDHLPDDLSVSKDEMQRYIKRLRKLVGSVRYFAVGEYGDKSDRPHYHLILFGLDYMDRPAIEKAWRKDDTSMGFVMVGDVTKDSARYVCGYCLKKMTSPTDPRLKGRGPEFALSSRRPGLGYPAIEIIAQTLLSKDYWTSQDICDSFSIGGKPVPIGRYLTSKLAGLLGTDPAVFYARFKEYQDQLFKDHITEEDIYYFSLVEKDRVKIEALEKKFKIFNKKRNL
jgi:hypothetical protein